MCVRGGHLYVCKRWTFIYVLEVSILFCFYDFSIGFKNYSDSVLTVTVDTRKSASYLVIIPTV